MSRHIKLKSVYEPAAPEDGRRYLAETFWPEGTETRDLIPCGWAREVAPSYYLSETAHGQNWPHARFREEYERELLEPERHARMIEIMREARTGPVTLLHKSRKEERLVGRKDTSVFDLREILEAGMKKEDESRKPDSARQDSGPIERWKEEGGR